MKISKGAEWVSNMNKKQQQIIGNTLVEEYAVPLKAEENATLQLLEYADRIANLDAFVVDYIRLEELQMYSEDRGIPVYTDVESLAIVKHDLAKDSIRTCLVKGFYMNVDLSVIFDMQSKSIRFNRSRFSTLNTEDIIAAVVAAPQS